MCIRDRSKLALQVLAPTILVVAVMGCMRGYFQGLGTMVPTAVSQIVEQIINAAVSIGAAYILFHYGLKIDAVLGTKTAAYAYGAAASTLGTGPVSYTHLDVYKRQGDQVRWSMLETDGEERIFTTVAETDGRLHLLLPDYQPQKAMIGQKEGYYLVLTCLEGIPVSYTHLDVYKRQGRRGKTWQIFQSFRT